MGRLYREPIPFRSARAEVQLEADALILRMPDGRSRYVALDGMFAGTGDGVVIAQNDTRLERRFVRMLVLERAAERTFVITPPDHGAVAPNVVRVPEAPADAAVIDGGAWEAITDWVMGGGRLAACAIEDLARLAVIASTQFAMLIGEVAAQRALELGWATRGLFRGGTDLETALQPLAEAARDSPRAAEALVSAFAHAAGASRRRRRAW
ncbi:MAG: hypothetical protein WKG01_05405 [Kofleriaceae bacterium]